MKQKTDMEKTQLSSLVPLHDCKTNPRCELGTHISAPSIQLRGDVLSNILNSCLNRPRESFPMSPGRIDIMVVDSIATKVDGLSNHIGTTWLTNVPGKSKPTPLKQLLQDHFSIESDLIPNLFNLMIKAKYPNERVYVTNLVKCFLERGQPSVSCINKCRDTHLMYEIQALQPKVIVLVGASTLRAFPVLIGQGGLDAKRGTITKVEVPGVPHKISVIPTYKPTFQFLVEENILPKIVKDLRLAYKCMKDPEYTVTPYVPEYTVLDTLSKVRDWYKEIKKSSIFSFDSETRGLNWWEEPVLSFQFCWGYPGGKTAVLPWFLHAEDVDPDRIAPFNIKHHWSSQEKEEIRALLIDLFTDDTIAKIAHNIKFDLNVVQTLLKVKVKGKLYDTMIMHHLLNETRPHDLDTLADIEFDVGDYSFPLREIVGHGKVKKPYDLIPSEMLWKYGAIDAESTFRLHSVYMGRLSSKPHLMNLYNEELEPNIRPLQEAEYYGCLVDKAVIKEQQAIYEKECEQLLKEIRFETKMPQFSPTNRDHILEYGNNIGVSSRLVDPRTKRPSTKKQILLELVDRYPIFDKVIKYKENHKLISTYLQSFLDGTDSDSRFHTSFKQHGTDTGRLSASRVHQIPRLSDEKTAAGIPQPRHAFIVPNGFDYVYLDFSQMELYIMALEANDKNMLEALKDDLHDYTASLFLSYDVNTFKKSVHRGYNRSNIGKPINFGLQYGSEGSQICEKNLWKDENGKERRFTKDMFYKGYRRWSEMFYQTLSFMKDVSSDLDINKGRVITSFGRERRLGYKLCDFTNKYAFGEARRQAINFRIQGAAASIMNRTINIIYDTIQSFIEKGKIKEGDIILLNTVHDSVGYQCKSHLTKWFSENVLVPAAKRPIDIYNGFSLPAKYGIGKSWAEAEMNSE